MLEYVCMLEYMLLQVLQHHFYIGVYITESCQPTSSERLLFDHVARHRKVVTIKEAAIELFGEADVQLFGNDKNFCAVLKVLVYLVFYCNLL